MEDIALIRLARLRRKRGALNGAADLYEEHVKHYHDDSEDRPTEPPTDETVEALSFLAEHYKNRGWLDKADSYCDKLLEVVGGHTQKNTEALALKREIRSRRNGSG